MLRTETTYEVALLDDSKEELAALMLDELQEEEAKPDTITEEKPQDDIEIEGPLENDKEKLEVNELSSSLHHSKTEEEPAPQAKELPDEVSAEKDVELV